MMAKDDAGNFIGNPDTYFQSGKEAEEMGRKGGIASGKARREKKALKEAVNVLLSSTPQLSEKDERTLEKLGIDISEIDNQIMLVTACYKQALKGDVRAMNLLTEWMDEKPAEKVELSTSEDATSNFLQMLNESARLLYGNEKENSAG